MVIDGVPVIGLAAPTLVGIFVLLVFTGRVVSYRIYEAAVKRAELAEETNKELLEQNNLLLNASLPTIVQILNSLRTAAEGGDDR